MSNADIDLIYEQGQYANSIGMSIKMNPYKDSLKSSIWNSGWEGTDVYFWLFGE